MGQKIETSEVCCARMCLFIAIPQRVPLHMNKRVPLHNHCHTQPLIQIALCVVVRCCRNGVLFTIVSSPLKHFYPKL
jgi:hypothetical protein